MPNDESVEIQSVEVPSFSSIFLPSGNLLVTYTGIINKDFHTSIVGFLGSLDEPKKDFYFIMSSPGGDATQIMGAPIILKELGVKKMISYGQCSSAALAIMMECRRLGVETYIDPLCHVVLHRCSTIMSEQRSERMRKFIQHFVADFEVTFDNINKDIIDKMTPEDKVDYNHGYDVYVLGSDLIKWGIFKEFNSKTFAKTPSKKSKG